MVAILVTAGGLHRQTPRVDACVGGIGPIEDWAAEADVIVLGEAVRVGDAVNRAPTPTPTSTPTATATTPPRTSTIPPPPPTPPLPVVAPLPDSILEGIGATLRVERVFAGGPAAEIEVDRESREFVEKALRDQQAGGGYFSDCSIDAFTPRFERGGRYLVFLTDRPDRFVHTILRVDGSDVRLDDPLLVNANNGVLYMRRTTFDRYFGASVTFQEDAGEAVFLTSGRVPLKTVLQAVAGLRGDPSISPPDTGSAGLAAGRR